jgi:hypothetical protein
MAGSLTDVWEKKVLDLIFRNASASATVPMGLDASSMWVALFTANPTDSTTGTEVTGGSYARVAIDRTGTGFAAATGTTATTSPAGTTTFATATADWGTVTGFGLCKSLAGSLSTDLVFWGSLTTSKAVLNGDTASILAASLTITCD